MDGQEIIRLIEQRRKQIGMSIAEFCRQARMSRQNYYRVFSREETKPALHLICDTAKIVGFQVNILIPYSNAKKPENPTR